MKMTSTLTAFLTAMLLTTGVSAAQFYKWTDEQGATHYSESPPPASAGKASEVKVRTKLPSGTREALESQQKAASENAEKGLAAGKKDEKSASTAKTAAEDKKSPEQYAEKCKTLRSNQEAMQSHGRVKESGADGSVRVLTEEEKKQRMDEVQREIKAFCES